MEEVSYTAIAKKRIVEFIERSTRFDLGNVEFSNETEFVSKFRVEVSHQLLCELNINTKVGSIDHDALDITVNSEEDFDTATDSLLREAESTKENFFEFQSEIDTSHYAKNKKKNKFKSYHKRVTFTYECPTCSGGGKVDCQNCGGNGQVTCSSCLGMGSETHHDTDSNGHSSSHSESCSWCMGSGRQRCSSCEGSGTKTCGQCSGHRRLTKIGTPEFFDEPTFRLAKIEPSEPDVLYAIDTYATLPRIAEDWAVQLERSVCINEDQKQIYENVFFQCDFYKGKVTVNGVSGLMVVFGHQASISDAGNLIENFVSPDLIALQSATKQLSLMDINTTKHLKLMASIFMESEVHQLAVQRTALNGDSPEKRLDLSNSLSRALSPEYLADALTAVKLSARLLSKVYAAYVSIITAAISLPIFLYLYLSGRGMALFLSAIGLYVLSGSLRWYLTHRQLELIGGLQLKIFAEKNGVTPWLRLGW